MLLNKIGVMRTGSDMTGVTRDGLGTRLVLTRDRLGLT